MTNQQLYLAIGIPSLLIFLSWLSNRSDINRLSDKVDGLRAEIYHEFKEFYRTLGQHDGQIEAIKERHK
jgi:hypothetical protein